MKHDAGERDLLIVLLKLVMKWCDGREVRRLVRRPGGTLGDDGTVAVPR